MNYYIPKTPKYPSYPRNGLFSGLNNLKGTQFSQSFTTNNNFKQYNSDYLLNYKATKNNINTNIAQDSVADRFEVDGLHNNSIGGNTISTVYSLIPEWINENYSMTQNKKPEYDQNLINTCNKCIYVGENHYDGNIVSNLEEECELVRNGFTKSINTVGSIHGNISAINNNNNNNNNNNGGNKRPRHFFCFSCNQFKPRSTKARFKVCKHVSCYHCLRKALHVEYWAAKNDIWDKCRAECPFCHISLDWTKMKPYIVLSLEAKQFPLMSLCDAEERQGEAFQVIQSFFPRGVPSHIIYGNKIDFSVKPKVTQFLFGNYLELLNGLDSYDKFFQPERVGKFYLDSSDRTLELENSNLTDLDKNDGFKPIKDCNTGKSLLNNSGNISYSNNGSSIISKLEVHSQANKDPNYYSYAISYTSASTTAPSCNTRAICANIDTSVSSTLESEEEVTTEYEVETEYEEGKRDYETNQDVSWAQTYNIYPDIFVSWRRSLLNPPV
ncbi:RING finger containing protein [Cryptosporidium meleagridis]